MNASQHAALPFHMHAKKLVGFFLIGNSDDAPVLLGGKDASPRPAALLDLPTGGACKNADERRFYLLDLPLSVL
ncbi:hypothetical protein HPP92_004543 [Vanilla planifolia]|uniref:Uncharacterized protein n=1 Tax=Vanilla planifolia TaxID=51239 RepID=A0A835VI78_VANPL|nr:hypothetical protein HPP92_004543 [Vanilla planifolia]